MFVNRLEILKAFAEDRKRSREETENACKFDFYYM